MFLNTLTKEEKNAFLELAHHIARSDNDFSITQKEIIAKYCMEMQIEDINFNENDFDINSTLDKVSNTESRKVIFLEIMALVYSDNLIHKEEENILNIMTEKLELNPALTIVYAEWAKAILSLYIQGQALIKL